MTAKHFRAIAWHLFAAHPDRSSTLTGDDRLTALLQWERDVRALADVCAASNDRFDRGRFERACVSGGR